MQIQLESADLIATKIPTQGHSTICLGEQFLASRPSGNVAAKTQLSLKTTGLVHVVQGLAQPSVGPMQHL